MDTLTRPVRWPSPAGAVSAVRQLLLAQPGNRERAILLAGAASHPLQARRWLRFLASTPMYWELARTNPRWVLKVFRPYLSNRLDCAGRVDVLTQHYQSLRDAGMDNWVARLARQPQAVCRFAGKSGSAFRLDLSAVGMDSREGELYLQLLANDVFLYRAAFSFFLENEEVVVKIGCVQGLRADDGADSIRSTTRELYGCRPKNLMISVVRDIGAYFGCSRMIGVSNANRILAYGGRYQVKVPDYDSTWEEMGALRTNAGDYELPCSSILKTSFDDIPSKKRSEAKKRNGLLASIFEEVRDNLDRERFTYQRCA